LKGQERNFKRGKLIAKPSRRPKASKANKPFESHKQQADRGRRASA